MHRTEQLSLFNRQPVRIDPSREEIEAARRGKRRWTRTQLAEWGVGWPPPKGWRYALERAADERDGRIPVVAAGRDGGFRDERFRQFYRRGER